MRVHDEASHLVGFVRNDRLVEKSGERQIGEGELRRHALGSRRGRHARQRVSAAIGRSFGQQIGEIAKNEALPVDRSGVHVKPPGG